MTVNFALMLLIAFLGTAPLLLAVFGFLYISKRAGANPRGGRRAVGEDKARPPEKYEVNGFDYIEPYVVRLLESDGSFALLRMFTPDGKRGFEIHKRDRVIKAGLTVDWREEPEREAAMRTFFDSLSVEPLYDYLSGIREATRFLTYPVKGDVSTITELVKRILEELYGIAPEEALDIEYSDR